MKTRFVSTYEYTEKMCRKVAVYVYYKRVLALVCHIVMAAVCAVGAAFSLYYVISGKEPVYHYSTYFFYALAPIAAEIAVYVKYRMMLKKEKQLLRGEGTELTVIADNDELTEKFGEETVARSPLFDVEKVYASKEFFLIIALSGEYFTFKRGCFSEGDENSFVSSVKARVREIHKNAIEKTKAEKGKKK